MLGGGSTTVRSRPPPTWAAKCGRPGLAPRAPASNYFKLCVSVRPLKNRKRKYRPPFGEGFPFQNFPPRAAPGASRVRRGAEPELSASCRTRANRRQTRLHTLTHGTEPARSADERRSRAASCTAAVSVHERWLCLNVRWRFRTVSPRRSHRVPASINSATSAERASWLAVSWPPAQTSRRLLDLCTRPSRRRRPALLGNDAMLSCEPFPRT